MTEGVKRTNSNIPATQHPITNREATSRREQQREQQFIASIIKIFERWQTDIQKFNSETYIQKFNSDYQKISAGIQEVKNTQEEIKADLQELVKSNENFENRFQNCKAMIQEIKDANAENLVKDKGRELRRQKEAKESERFAKECAKQQKRCQELEEEEKEIKKQIEQDNLQHEANLQKQKQENLEKLKELKRLQEQQLKELEESLLPSAEDLAKRQFIKDLMQKFKDKAIKKEIKSLSKMYDAVTEIESKTNKIEPQSQKLHQIQIDTARSFSKILTEELGKRATDPAAVAQIQETIAELEEANEELDEIDQIEQNLEEVHTKITSEQLPSVTEQKLLEKSVKIEEKQNSIIQEQQQSFEPKAQPILTKQNKEEVLVAATKPKVEVQEAKKIQKNTSEKNIQSIQLSAESKISKLQKKPFLLEKIWRLFQQIFAQIFKWWSPDLSTHAWKKYEISSPKPSLVHS